MTTERARRMPARREPPTGGVAQVDESPRVPTLTTRSDVAPYGLALITLGIVLYVFSTFNVKGALVGKLGLVFLLLGLLTFISQAWGAGAAILAPAPPTEQASDQLERPSNSPMADISIAEPPRR